jgi:hypothetical protein
MSQALPPVRVTIGGEIFPARLRYDLAPQSCARLEAPMPYHGELIHARENQSTLPQTGETEHAD